MQVAKYVACLWTLFLFFVIIRGVGYVHLGCNKLLRASMLGLLNVLKNVSPSSSSCVNKSSIEGNMDGNCWASRP